MHRITKHPISRNVSTGAAALVFATGIASGQCQLAPECASEADQGYATINVASPFNPAQPERRVQRVLTVLQQDDQDEYKIIVNGDEVEAWINGERLSNKQVKVQPNVIVLMGEDGQVITEFNLGFAGEAPSAPAVPGIVWDLADVDVEPGTFTLIPGQPAVPMPSNPRVMVGINMGALDTGDERVWDFLEREEIDEDEVIYVTNVIEGLPADDAGLREGDVIVAIDGDWGASAGRLRDVLADRDPGDALEVSVFRRGRVRDFEIELAEYSAEALGVIEYFAADVETTSPDFWVQREAMEGQVMKDFLAELERMQGDRGIAEEEMRIRIMEMAENLSQEAHRFRELELDEFDRIERFQLGDGDARLFVRPAPRAENQWRDTPGFEVRMDRLEERLDRLEGRLDRLLEVLERRERDRD